MAGYAGGGRLRCSKEALNECPAFEPRVARAVDFAHPACATKLPGARSIVGRDYNAAAESKKKRRRDKDEQETTKGNSVRETTQGKQRSLRSLEWLNFFLADVQTGLGPFLAAYLASNGWHPDRVGFALTFGGLVTVALQTPAGAAIDAVHRKRTLVAVCLGVLVAAAFLLMRNLSAASVYSAQFLIGGVGTFLAPTVTAITLGIVGAGAFDKQFGKNQAFNSAGNVFTALLVAYVSCKFGYRAIFVVSALVAIPAAASLLAINPKQIDYARARGAVEEKGQAQGLSSLLRDRVLLS